MPRSIFSAAVLAAILLHSLAAAAQVTTPTAPPVATRDAQAIALAATSLKALTGGTTLSDLTLQGNATYISGSDEEMGPATLLASGNSMSRTVLSLTDGQRVEIRNGPAGDWIGTDSVEHPMATHNCWPDADWFYPGLSFQALSTDAGLGIAYVGVESKNGLAVQHVRLFRIIAGQTADTTTLIQGLSAVDLYLDAASYFPLFLDFNLHPDDDLNLNIPVEVQFSNYQAGGGIEVPTHVQKYVNGSLQLDLAISAASVNSGLPPADFAVTSATGGAQ